VEHQSGRARPPLDYRPRWQRPLLGSGRTHGSHRVGQDSDQEDYEDTERVSAFDASHSTTAALDTRPSRRSGRSALAPNASQNALRDRRRG
jgi:hypothetical protein